MINFDLDKTLSGFGVRQEDRQSFVRKMNAAARDPEIERKVRKALDAAGVNASSHDKVLEACEAEGLFPGAVGQMHASASSGRLEKIEAALQDPNKVPAIRFAIGSLRRIGISIEAATDINTLNQAMTAKGLSPESRMTIKTALARAGIID